MRGEWDRDDVGIVLGGVSIRDAVRVGKSIARLRIRWYLAVVTTQFLTDQEGKRVAVVLPVEEFDELMEDVSDLAAVAERRNEERFTLDQVKQRLIADGLLPD